MTLLLKDPQALLDYSEALQAIDALLCPVAEAAPATEPPAGPAEGQCFVVATGATGAWAGHDGALAAFTAGGWRFIQPQEGQQIFNRASGETLLRRNGSWESGIVHAREIRISGEAVLGERQPAIVAPSGGATVDAECRAAVASLIAALRAHGLIG